MDVYRGMCYRKQGINAFEYAKLNSVKALVRLYQLRGKMGKAPERYLFGVAVSINILEAIMQGGNTAGLKNCQTFAPP